jgi:hypothetical protein
MEEHWFAGFSEWNTIIYPVCSICEIGYFLPPHPSPLPWGEGENLSCLCSNTSTFCRKEVVPSKMARGTAMAIVPETMFVSAVDQALFF